VSARAGSSPNEDWITPAGPRQSVLMRWLLLVSVLGACERPNLVLEVEHPHGLAPGHRVRVGEAVVGEIKRVDRRVAPVRIEAFVEDPSRLGLRADACARPTDGAVVLQRGRASEPFAGSVVPACDLGGRAVQEAFGRLRDVLQRSKERGVDLSGQLERLERAGIGVER